MSLTMENNSNNANVNDPIVLTRQSLQTLNVKKQSLEYEAEAIASELTTGENPMGIDTPLVDEEGYPRDDIDVYRARTLRGRLAVIKTDHKRILMEIDNLLKKLALLQNASKADEERRESEARLNPKPKPKYDPVTKKWVVRNWDGTISGAGKEHDQKRSFDNLTATIIPPSQMNESSSSATSTTNPTATSNTSQPSPNQQNSSVEEAIIHHRAAEVSIGITPPFARVNSVAGNSPAYTSKLQENDLILAFGAITLEQQVTPSSAFQAIGELVPRAAANNEVIEIKVQRGTQNPKIESLRLHPRPWNGRGLLGCHIVPL